MAAVVTNVYNPLLFVQIKNALLSSGQLFCSLLKTLFLEALQLASEFLPYFSRGGQRDVLLWPGYFVAVFFLLR